MSTDAEELILTSWNQLLKSVSADYPELAIDPRFQPSADTITRLALFVEQLAKWTARVDLVAPAPLQQLVERHILDSLACFMLVKTRLANPEHTHWLDVGSGAGLPGLVIGLLEMQSNAGSEVLLLEPREKRVVFLQEMKRRLALEYVQITCERLEDFSATTERKFELIVSRALGQSALVLECAQRIANSQTLVAEMVGPSWEQQAGSREQSWSAPEKLLYQLPSEGPRAIAIWRNCPRILEKDSKQG